MNKTFIFLVCIGMNSIFVPVIYTHPNNEAEATISQSDVQDESVVDELLMSEEPGTIYNQYDKEICEHVAPPKPSSLEAWMRNIGVSVLLKYIAVKAYIRNQARKVKQTLGAWFLGDH